MTDSVPEADRPNLAETKRDSLAPSRGGRPIRKRGFHRALKRREAWALLEQANRQMINKLCSEMFYERMAATSLRATGLALFNGDHWTTPDNSPKLITD